jgi:hypothetical protein
MDSIAECDQNITDADTFLQDINAFEQQLQAEAAQAKTFIESVTREVKQQQEEKKAAQAKQEEAAAAAQSSQAPQDEPNQSIDPNVAPDAANASSSEPAAPDADDGTQPDAAPAADAAPADEGKVDAAAPDEPAPDAAAPTEEEGPDPGEVATFQRAANYVSDAADTAAEQLASKRDDYKNQVEAAVVNREKKSTEKVGTEGDKLVADFRAYVTTAKTELHQFKVAKSVDEALVDALVSKAGQVDEQVQHANDALDKMFTSEYEKVKAGPKDDGFLGYKSAIAGVNDVAAPIDHAADASMDFVQPGADAVWNTGATAASFVADPVANAATTTVGYAARPVTYAGAALVSPAVDVADHVGQAYEDHKAEQEKADQVPM